MMLHGDILGERARQTPDANALVDRGCGRRFSYRELDREASRWATACRNGLGLQPGDRVALLSGNRWEFIALFFGAAKARVVLVPLNTHLAVPELSQILEDADPSVLVVDGAYSDTAAGLLHRVSVPRVVGLDGTMSMDAEASENLLASNGEGCDLETPHPDDLMALLYTSGSSGRPKGVMIPHRMVAFNSVHTVANWGLRPEDVSPIFTPLYHAGGLGAFLTPIFAVGGTIVLYPSFDPGEIWKGIEQDGCTVVLGVPTIWKMLADHPGFHTADLSSVRWFISGGAPLPESLIRRYKDRGVVLRQGYGLTEVGVNCFAMTNRDAWERPGVIGKPFLYTEAKLVDEKGREVSQGDVGELLLRGPHVSAGYWRNDAQTAAAYDRDGYFHTGDLAVKDADGFFRIAGRKKEMYISGGVNIFPAEIEAVLLQHPAVADAAVVGVAHETWGEVGAAFLVAVPGETLDPDAVQDWLSEQIARYKVPKYVIIVDRLPRTAYGKVRRAELVQRFMKEGQNP